MSKQTKDKREEKVREAIQHLNSCQDPVKTGPRMCNKCKDAKEVLKKYSRTYLSVTDGWVEKKFEEMMEEKERLEV